MQLSCGGRLAFREVWRLLASTLSGIPKVQRRNSSRTGNVQVYTLDNHRKSAADRLSVSSSRPCGIHMSMPSGSTLQRRPAKRSSDEPTSLKGPASRQTRLQVRRAWLLRTRVPLVFVRCLLLWDDSISSAIAFDFRVTGYYHGISWRCVILFMVAKICEALPRAPPGPIQSIHLKQRPFPWSSGRRGEPKTAT